MCVNPLLIGSAHLGNRVHRSANAPALAGSAESRCGYEDSTGGLPASLHLHRSHPSERGSAKRRHGRQRRHFRNPAVLDGGGECDDGKHSSASCGWCVPLPAHLHPSPLPAIAEPIRRTRTAIPTTYRYTVCRGGGAMVATPPPGPGGEDEGGRDVAEASRVGGGVVARSYGGVVAALSGAGSAPLVEVRG